MPPLSRYLPILLLGILLGVSGTNESNQASVAAVKGSIQIAAHEQLYRPTDGVTSFEGNVLITMNQTQIQSDHADFHMDNKGEADQAVFNTRTVMVRKNPDMQQTIQADKVSMGLKNDSVDAQGKVVTQMTGSNATKDTKKSDVFIQSDHQVFDQEKHVMSAVGNVLVKKDDMTATSPEALVFTNPSGTADKVVFLKGAHITQGEEDVSAETVTVKIDSGDFYAEKNVKSVVTSKDSAGKPTTIKVTSNFLELDNKTGTLITNGNTVVDFEDYVARGPKAVVYKENNALDRIYLTGRAQIEDAERKVTGNTVTIKINPKEFNAEGDVNTFIKTQRQTNTTPTPATNGKEKSGPKKPPAKNTAATGTASKTVKATVSNPQPTGAVNSDFDQEMMIENAKHKPGKTQ